MGQYWFPVNLDKREFVDPHKLGAGLKLWEQLAASPGTGAALVVLCAAMPEPRGGGDLKPHPAVGRWAGDRIALVGDYAEDSDLPGSPIPAGCVYGLCGEDRRESWVRHIEDRLRRGERQTGDEELLVKLKEWGAFTDVSEMVCEVIARELGGTFVGDGWRDYRPLSID